MPLVQRVQTDRSGSLFSQHRRHCAILRHGAPAPRADDPGCLAVPFDSGSDDLHSLSMRETHGPHPRRTHPANQDLPSPNILEVF